MSPARDLFTFLVWKMFMTRATQPTVRRTGYSQELKLLDILNFRGTGSRRSLRNRKINKQN